MTKQSRAQLGWPAAATLIAALVGAASASLALALAPRQELTDPGRFASAREIGEVKARLSALERSTQQLRTELRTDLHEVRDLVRQLVQQP